MANTAKTKATVDRLLAKVTKIGVITKRTDILGGVDMSTPVRVRIITRKAEPDQPTRCEAIMSATAIAIEGGELLLKGITYDIVSVEQKGVGNEHFAQRVVLHER